MDKYLKDIDLQFAHFAKMVAMDGQRYRKRQKFGAAEKGPHHQIPILDAFFAEYSDSDSGAKKRQKTLEVNRYRNFRCLVFF